MSGPTFTDLFCGAGGATSGLVEAGLTPVLAANHWPTAIQTHAANHPDMEHLCADVNNLDMRRIPSTEVLWASVICTEISPAGGRRRTNRPSPGQLALMEYGALPAAAFERTRATALDVIRATEVHRYAIVVVENVPEFATDWELFDWWRGGMHLLRPGYRSQIVSVSSAHVGDPATGNDPAAQWRNRIYIMFVRADIPMPDLDPRPPAHCTGCGTDIHARQSWNPDRHIGSYRQQYRYRCPNATCRHQVVEPYVLPAAAIIDWADPGQRIGDRTRPLAASTMRKIRDGLTHHTDPAPLLIPLAGWNRTTVPDTTDQPLRTLTARETTAVLTPAGAFIAELRGGGSTHRPVTHPLATIAAGGNHHGLVIPYRRTSPAKPTNQPLHTLSTIASASLLLQPDDHDQADAWTDQDIAECRFRMLKPREQLAAQRFHPDYIVTGNIAEQTMQAGNAVSVNVAHWLGHRITAALDTGRAAA